MKRKRKKNDLFSNSWTTTTEVAMPVLFATALDSVNIV